MNAGDRTQPQRRRPATCLSDFALDRLHQGEDDGAGPRDHLARCAGCAERLATLAAARAPALDLDGLLRRAGDGATLNPPPRRRARWAAMTVLAAVGAAGAVVWLRAAAPHDQRIKGGLHLAAIAQRPDGRTHRVGNGDTLAPGDRLRFEIGAPDDGYVTIVSLDSTGAVTAFYPAEGRALPVVRGQRQLSARSVVLDDARGPELIVLTSCPQPYTVDAVLVVARAQLVRAGNRPRHVGRLDLPCPQLTLWINKAPR